MLEFLFFFTLVMVFIGIISIPIMIAGARGICGGRKTTITILSWLGIFLGITWVVALCLSLIWEPECGIGQSNLDKLEKLSQLYKDKVITKAEFESMKSKLLN